MAKANTIPAHASGATTELDSLWFTRAWWALNSFLSDGIHPSRLSQAAFCVLFLLPYYEVRKTSGRPTSRSYADRDAAATKLQDRVEYLAGFEKSAHTDTLQELVGAFLSMESAGQKQVKKNSFYQIPYRFLYCYFSSEELQPPMYAETIRYFAAVLSCLPFAAQEASVLEARIDRFRAQNGDAYRPSYMTRQQTMDTPMERMAQLLFDALLDGAFAEARHICSQELQQHWEDRQWLVFREAEAPDGADQTPVAAHTPIAAPLLPPAADAVSLPVRLLPALLRCLDVNIMQTEEIGVLAEFLASPEARPLRADAPIEALGSVIRQRYTELTAVLDIENQSAMDELSTCQRVYQLLKKLTAD